MMFRLRRLIWSALIVAGLVGRVAADTVNLKDGTVLEGTVLTQDDQQITMEVRVASGTIIRKQTVKRSDVATITMSSAEEKSRVQMEAAFDNTKTFQLDPTTSWPVEKYDQALTGVFRPFLSRYPNSPHAKEITDKISQWQAERDQVAAGKAKFRGQWLPAAEARKRYESEIVPGLLQQAQALLDAGQFESAVVQFGRIGELTQQPVTQVEARRMQAKACDQWLNVLRSERQQIPGEIKANEQKADAARVARQTAEAKRKYYLWQLTNTGKRSIQQDKQLNQYSADAIKGGADAAAAFSKIDSLKARLVTVENQLTAAVTYQRQTALALSRAEANVAKEQTAVREAREAAQKLAREAEAKAAKAARAAQSAPPPDSQTVAGPEVVAQSSQPAPTPAPVVTTVSAAVVKPEGWLKLNWFWLVLIVGVMAVSLTKIIQSASRHRR